MFEPSSELDSTASLPLGSLWVPSWFPLSEACLLAVSDVNEAPTDAAYVNVLTRGDLSSLRWIASPLRHFVSGSPAVQLCHVYYSSLNFRDIMLATGKLPPDAIPGSVSVHSK